jgi:hypothetical protein
MKTPFGTWVFIAPRLSEIRYDKFCERDWQSGGTCRLSSLQNADFAKRCQFTDKKMPARGGHKSISWRRWRRQDLLYLYLCCIATSEAGKFVTRFLLLDHALSEGARIGQWRPMFL